jgi:hypothetical protein
MLHCCRFMALLAATLAGTSVAGPNALHAAPGVTTAQAGAGEEMALRDVAAAAALDGEGVRQSLAACFTLPADGQAAAP